MYTSIHRHRDFFCHTVAKKSPPKRITPCRKYTENITQSATEDNSSTSLACTQRAVRSSVCQSTSAKPARPSIKSRIEPKKCHSGSARVHGKISLLVLAKRELPKTRLWIFRPTPKTSSWLVYVHASVAINVSRIRRAIRSDRIA